MTKQFDAFIGKLVALFKQKRSWYVVAAIILLVIIGLFFFGGSEPEEAAEVKVSEVEVESVANLASPTAFSAVGTLSAVSEARLQTEAGGRVVSVPVAVGDFVRAGTVIATLENSSERAQLLQAEGSYEAAVAASKQSESGERSAAVALVSAENAAKTAIASSYTNGKDVLTTSIDRFYANPDSVIPGLRVGGDTQFRAAERKAFRAIMPEWQSIAGASDSANLTAHIDTSIANTNKLLVLLDSFIGETSGADRDKTLDGLPLSSYNADLLAARTTLTTSLASLQTAKSNLINAKEAVASAAIAGPSSEVSSANAQLKIALGALRAAEANYNKTIVRSPISGAVNALYLKAGEYVSPNQPAAIIANNNGLEIATAVNQDDSLALKIGDSVSINKTATGTISAIGAGIDPNTGKIAVKISIDEPKDLKNGDTVTLDFSTGSTTVTTTDISLPLSAIKMTGSGPVVFTVSDENKLTSQAVVLGPVRGGMVVVTSGVTRDTEIVTDARGHKEGEVVTVSNR